MQHTIYRHGAYKIHKINNLASMNSHIKIILIIINIVFYSNLSFGQKIFFDSLWHKTSIENATYYRLIDTIESEKYSVHDFFMNGLTQMNGEFSSIDKEIKHGHFECFYNNGQIKKECSYNKNRLHGEYNKWFEDGKKEISGEYNLGKRVNLWTLFNEDGSIYLQGNYSNNKKNGKWSRFFNDGTLKESFNMKNNVFDGYAIAWDSLGNRLGILDLNSKLTKGSISIYYPNGQIATEGKFKNKKAVGYWKMYYPNGSIQKEGEVKNGKMIGQWTTYDSDGSPNSIIIFDKKNTEDFPVDLNMAKEMLNIK